MSVILTSDVHLNEKPSENFRWGLFDWLLQQKADELILCGDITDAKDRHSAQLVNRLCDKLIALSDKLKVIWLAGNHDFFDPRVPFFRFLNNSPNITYIHEPKIEELSIGKATFIPACVKWNFKLQVFPYVFTHVTFNGAKAENGTLLSGVDPHLLDHYDGRCFSGDIHVPQKIGKNIEYIGAPYHIRFGDSFDPRIIFINNDGKTKDLYYPAPKKQVFDIFHPDDLLKKQGDSGDHVKVRYYLKRSDYSEWRRYKEEIHSIAEEKGWLLFGVESIPVELVKVNNSDKGSIVQGFKQPLELILDYAKRNRISDEYIDIGKGLLK